MFCFKFLDIDRGHEEYPQGYLVQKVTSSDKIVACHFPQKKDELLIMRIINVHIIRFQT